MKTIRRYGLSTKGSLDTDEDSPLIKRGLGVPSKFTDTVGRRNTRKVMNVLGLLCLVTHVMLLIFVSVNYFSPIVELISETTVYPSQLY